MIKFKVPDKIYHSNISVIACCKKDELDNYFSKKYGLDCGICEKSATVFSVRDNSKGLERSYLIIPSFDWTVSQWALLIHEIFHLTCLVLRDVGVNLTYESEEAYAYYLDYLSETIIGKLMKQTGYTYEEKQNG